jgi:DNA-binding CsgD family transcriptional regulator
VPSLRAADFGTILELAGEALRSASPHFPDLSMTGHLREVFQADFAGAATIDLRGTASHRWADTPRQVEGDFHKYATAHPLALAYKRTSEPEPLRLSDVASARTAPPAFGGSGMSRVLAIPLAITPGQVSAIALMRGGSDFTARDLQFARQLRPVLSGIYELGGRLACAQPSPADASVSITARELDVFTLMADGLKAVAIGRRLGISPRTVSKHVENIYGKLGTHDRVTAIRKAQDLGLLARTASLGR